MAKLSIQAGATSQTINIFIADSSSTTGAGLTGLAFNTASLVAYYALPRAAAVAITLATQTVTGAYSSGGFVEISSANMPGWYRLDLPDAAIASGRFVSVHLKGATNMAPLPIEIELTAWNNQDSVRGGLTALPNAAAGATNGLPLSVDSSGRVDVLKINGTSQTARDIGASVLLSAGTGTGQLDFTSGVVKSNLVQILATALTETAGQIAAAFKQFFNIASPTSTMNTITTVSTVSTVTGLTASNLDATVSSRMATYTQPTGFLAATFPTSVASPTNITAGTITTVTNLTNAPTAGDLTTTMKASVKTQAVNALSVDTYVETTGAPAATASLADKIGFGYEALRNKLTTSATAKTFFNDSGTSQWSKALADDGTTYTESEGV